jgi:hypothetical protein
VLDLFPYLEDGGVVLLQYVGYYIALFPRRKNSSKQLQAKLTN